MATFLQSAQKHDFLTERDAWVWQLDMGNALLLFSCSFYLMEAYSFLWCNPQQLEYQVRKEAGIFAQTPKMRLPIYFLLVLQSPSCRLWHDFLSGHKWGFFKRLRGENQKVMVKRSKSPLEVKSQPTRLQGIVQKVQSHSHSLTENVSNRIRVKALSFQKFLHRFNSVVFWSASRSERNMKAKSKIGFLFPFSTKNGNALHCIPQIVSCFWFVGANTHSWSHPCFGKKIRRHYFDFSYSVFFSSHSWNKASKNLFWVELIIEHIAIGWSQWYSWFIRFPENVLCVTCASDFIFLHCHVNHSTEQRTNRVDTKRIEIAFFRDCYQSRSWTQMSDFGIPSQTPVVGHSWFCFAQAALRATYSSKYLTVWRPTMACVALAWLVHCATWFGHHKISFCSNLLQRSQVCGQKRV